MAAGTLVAVAGTAGPATRAPARGRRTSVRRPRGARQLARRRSSSSRWASTGAASCLDVVGEHVVAAREGRARLARARSSCRLARGRGAQAQVGRGGGWRRPGRRRTAAPARRACTGRTSRDQGPHGGGVGDGLAGRRAGRTRRGRRASPSSAATIGVAHRHPRHEPVALGLGQRVGALHLDRVLRGDDDERRLERVGDAVDGDLPLLHALQQRRLRLGRGPVDLVADHDVGEDRARLELEVARLLVVDAHAGDVARQQVRGELDAAHRAVDRAGERLGQHRLADAGHVLDQQVALARAAPRARSHDLGLALDHRLDGATCTDPAVAARPSSGASGAAAGRRHAGVPPGSRRGRRRPTLPADGTRRRAAGGGGVATARTRPSRPPPPLPSPSPPRGGRRRRSARPLTGPPVLGAVPVEPPSARRDPGEGGPSTPLHRTDLRRRLKFRREPAGSALTVVGSGVMWSALGPAGGPDPDREEAAGVPRHALPASGRQGPADPPGEVPRPARGRAGPHPRAGALPVRLPRRRVRPHARAAAPGARYQQAGPRLPARAAVRRVRRDARQAGPHHDPDPAAHLRRPRPRGLRSSVPAPGSRSGTPGPGRPTWPSRRRRSPRPPRRWCRACSDRPPPPARTTSTTSTTGTTSSTRTTRTSAPSRSPADRTSWRTFPGARPSGRRETRPDGRSRRTRPGGRSDTHLTTPDVPRVLPHAHRVPVPDGSWATRTSREGSR